MTGLPGAPPLPPSPMSAEAAPVRPPDRVLPWFTPLLTGLAGAIAGLVWHHWYAHSLGVPAARYIVVASALMGLGACLSDRLPSRVPRVVRWGLGTCAGVLVPVSGLLRFMSGYPMMYVGAWSSLTATIRYALLTCAALGVAFGSLAGSGPRRWRMPLEGGLLATFLGALATAWPTPVWFGYAYTFEGTLTATWTGSSGYGGEPLRGLLSDALLGLLLGLAFAIGDRYAVERKRKP